MRAEASSRCYLFFFFKQKTAYEMVMSDWSSDVCSSDLFVADGDDRGLVEHDALATHVDERVGGAEIDGEVRREIATKGSEHVLEIEGVLRGAEPSLGSREGIRMTPSPSQRRQGL